METSLVNKLAVAALSCLLLVCAPSGHAGMLTFDDLEFGGSTAGESIWNSSAGYGGFNWDTGFSAGSTTASGFSSAATSGDQFLFNKGQQRTLSISRATPFDFLGASFGFKSSDPARRIKFLAYDMAGTKVAETGYQALDRSGLTSLQAFITDIYRLEIGTYGGTFAMDNFSFRDVAVKVTEAGSRALLVIGLIGLWAARRRGQRRA